MWEWIIGCVVVLLIAVASIVIVRPTERGLIERLGKYNRFANPGLNLVFPLVERAYGVNVTERMVDAERQEVITKDNLNAAVDAQVYFKVKPDEESVKNSQYSVDNVDYQMVQLARTTLRNIVGNLTLTDANSKRNVLNTMLEKELKSQTSGWGVEIIRTELKEIEPPQDVQQTMNAVVKAENTKIANKDLAEARKIEAEGVKWAAIQQAEGLRQARILEAEGQAEAIKKVADADAWKIKVVNESAQKYFKEQAVDFKKLEVATEVMKDNSKFFISEGTDLMAVVGDTAGVVPVVKRK